MKWVKCSERLPKTKINVFAKNEKGFRCVAYYVKDYEYEIEFDDDDTPDFVHVNKEKGIMTLKEGWYEDCENVGYYDIYTHQRKIVEWLDETTHDVYNVEDAVDGYIKLRRFAEFVHTCIIGSLERNEPLNERDIYVAAKDVLSKTQSYTFYELIEAMKE